MGNRGQFIDRDNEERRRAERERMIASYPLSNQGRELNADEEVVVSALAAVWNAFLLLPVEHADDQDEFRRLIHAAQEKVLCRPARRTINR